VWALEDLVAAHPVVLARIVPFLTDTAPSHPHCYPVYAKCVELDLPLSINTGIPGPPRPGECQNPMHLDRVCLDFPDLRLCMAHGADPWWDLAIRLMVKYPNLHLMTSAWSPKYLPPALLRYMDSRGREKVIFASDHPMIPMERAVTEARQLDLRPEALAAFLHGNAARLFFSPRKRRHA
jgi:predicted TIM-barrel fold metal-dependent hydrolase